MLSLTLANNMLKYTFLRFVLIYFLEFQVCRVGKPRLKSSGNDYVVNWNTKKMKKNEKLSCFF